MTANTTILIQLVMTFLQVLNAVNVAQLPVGWQGTFMGILTIGQAVQAVIAHHFTPSGVAITSGAVITTAEKGPQPATAVTPPK